MIPRENLRRVCEAFERNFAEREELGASVSIWQDGHEVLSVARGSRDKDRAEDWNAETIVPVWSATKGPASACVHRALGEAGIPLTNPVASIWPGLDARITFAHTLNHQSGLPALDENVDVFDYEAVIGVIERQTPHWEPGTAHGYHPRTFGFVLDEIVRRVGDCASLGDYWRKHFAEPLGLDFWIGLPEDEHHRLATVYPGKMRETAEESAF